MPRRDQGQRHRQLHKQLEQDAADYCDSHGVLYIQARKVPVGRNRWISTMPAGFPDAFILEPGRSEGESRDLRHGLAVEFKIRPDELSDNQIRWQDNLRAKGYRCVLQPALCCCVYFAP